ncbi:MAG TPA: hypothetical protein VN821_06255 [Candidatus Udaeobacter sp.]|nr:hypothetical protein [Candidatus Udaeobacter sp.]
MSIQDDILADHQRMWRSFCRLTTVAVIVVVTILGLMGIFLL